MAITSNPYSGKHEAPLEGIIVMSTSGATPIADLAEGMGADPGQAGLAYQDTSLAEPRQFNIADRQPVVLTDPKEIQDAIRNTALPNFDPTSGNVEPNYKQTYYTDANLPRRKGLGYPVEHLSAEVAEEIRKRSQLNTPYTSDLLKAMSTFTEAQTAFINSGRGHSAEEYVQILTTYSHAQTAMIAAYTALLKQMGVV